MSQQINLFDPRFRPQKPHFSARTMAWAVLAVGALAILIGEVYAFQNRRLEAALAETEKQAAQFRERAAALARDIGGPGRGGALADELARVEQQLQIRRQLLESLHGGAGGAAEGFSPYLAALARQSVEGVWLTGIDIAGSTGELSLKGRVLEGELVPAYIQRLHREPLFKGRAVQDLQLAAKNDGARRHVEFSLKLPAPKGAS